MTREEEKEIIGRVLAGNTEAFEQLVLEHQKNVYNLALRMVSNPDDAFDMSQEAFLRAFNSLGSFRGDSKFSVWLYRLTSNVCLDFLRKSKRRKAGSLTYMNSENEEQELDIIDERFSPETELEKKELRESVRAGLESLPDDFRTILVLREINGLSYDEISDVTGLEQGTVKSRLFRARKRLCALLSDDGNFPPSPPSKRTKGV